MHDQLRLDPKDKPTPILHVQCPECQSPKAVVAATHYSVMMCFCPACEHVWDCDAPRET
jgi:hypothetical protein